MPVSGLQRTWAPEWFIDSNGSVNIIVSLSTQSTGNTFRPHLITATNSALTSWSTPVPFSGLASNYIDTFVVKIGSTYHAFIKSTLTQLVEYATASSLAGPYTMRGTGNWAGWGTAPLEGQALVQLDNGCWRIYFDGYTRGTYYFSDSCNTFATWTAPQTLPGLSGFARHFTVLKERVAGGVTIATGNRSFQSVNFTDRYVRHRDFLGYIEPVSSSSSAQVKQDSTFNVVAGLADPNCYSFVGTGGRYLRHANFRLRLDASDGSALFRNDATFCARPGSVSGSIALESYNFPGRYIRHRNYELWVDLYQDNATFRADSSFRVVAPWAG